MLLLLAAVKAAELLWRYLKQDATAGGTITGERLKTYSGLAVEAAFLSTLYGLFYVRSNPSHGALRDSKEQGRAVPSQVSDTIAEAGGRKIR